MFRSGDDHAAGRANPNVDREVVALMLIDAAFGRAGRPLMLSSPGAPDQNDPLPAFEQTAG